MILNGIKHQPHAVANGKFFEEGFAVAIKPSCSQGGLFFSYYLLLVN